MGKQFILIGAGQASVSAARTLRRLDFDGDIVIVGDEVPFPYQRPPLSKEYLQGQASFDDILSAPGEWYKHHDVSLELGKRATFIDVETLEVTLDDGTKLSADAVLIATGGRPKQLEGAEPDTVRYLRTLEDADCLKADIRPGGRVIVIGGGFIGSEVAASAKAIGAEVTILEASEVPLQKILGEEIGGICGAIHNENGVTLRSKIHAKAVTKSERGIEVTTSDGDTLVGDIVVAGIGILPNDQIARASEITVGNGIRVDEFCRTSAEGVYAAGDVANAFHPVLGRRVRIEHFDNATRQGAVAAKNMMGIRTEHDALPWFWSDQYDYNLQYAGCVTSWQEVIIRGSAEERDFIAFYINDGKVDAAFAVNRGGDIMLAKTLIADRTVVDKVQLANDDISLEEIVLASEEEEETETSGEPGKAEGDFQFAVRSGRVREGSVRRVVVGNTELAIARSKGKAYALHNLCTHLACHLASGKIEDGGLTCLCHGSVFELESGVPINPPATRPVKTYPVREKDGYIYVNLK